MEHMEYMDFNELATEQSGIKFGIEPGRRCTMLYSKQEQEYFYEGLSILYHKNSKAKSLLRSSQAGEAIEEARQTIKELQDKLYRDDVVYTKEENLLLGKGLLGVIDNACEAQKLVCNYEIVELIDLEISKIRELLDKLEQEGYPEGDIGEDTDYYEEGKV